MNTFDSMNMLGHEQVVFCRNPETGLRAIIAIHDTTLGPALGGCRLYPYTNEAEALRDVLRLSRGMTYKAAAAGLDLGGGKAVIIGDPSLKSEGLFRAFGRHVEALGGRYITAEDMNTTVEDMGYIQRETRFVTGASQNMGGSGNPAPLTAWGVFHGIKAALEEVFGSSDVRGRTVALQGVGNVGWHLARYLNDAGAKLVVTDTSRARIDEAVRTFGAKAVALDDIYDVRSDVFSPCAIGATVNARTIPRIVAPIVAGAANNILEEEDRDSETLAERGILYAPDYVINAGGLISVWSEVNGWPRDKSMDDAADIFRTSKRIFAKAKEEGLPPLLAANRYAEERIRGVARIHEFRLQFQRAAAPRLPAITR